MNFEHKNKLDLPSNVSSLQKGQTNSPKGHLNISHNEIKDSPSLSKEQVSLDMQKRSSSNSLAKRKRSSQSK